MARKARLTVFSRFLIMMLIVGPLAFFAASYYNGEDGLQTIKNLINNQKEQVSETRTNRNDDASTNEDNKEAKYEIRKLKEELEYKQKRLDEMYKENEQLKQQVDKLESQIANGTTPTNTNEDSGN